MAQKPRSRKHEDRLCKLECKAAENEDTVKDILRACGFYVVEYPNGKWGYSSRPTPRTFWQKLNDYLSR